MLQDNLSEITSQEVQSFYILVSNNVKMHRTNAGLSQLDLALKIGITSVAFYSNCESLRYNKHFNLEHIYRIAKVLDVDVCELIR